MRLSFSAVLLSTLVGVVIAACPTDLSSSCQTLSSAGLLNLNLLGCSTVSTIKVLDDLSLKRHHDAVELVARALPKREDVCNDFSNAGLLNLDLLGCSSADISPTINVLSDLHLRRSNTCATFARKGLDASALGCVKKRSNVPDVGPRSITQLCQTLAQQGLSNVAVLGCTNNMISSNALFGKRSQDVYRGNDLTKSTYHKKKSTCTASAFCQSVSKAGLINLSLLGCSDTAITPVLNIADELLARGVLGI